MELQDTSLHETDYWIKTALFGDVIPCSLVESYILEQHVEYAGNTLTRKTSNLIKNILVRHAS
jgi:hypothetical protein